MGVFSKAPSDVSGSSKSSSCYRKTGHVTVGNEYVTFAAYIVTVFHTNSVQGQFFSRHFPRIPPHTPGPA